MLLVRAILIGFALIISCQATIAKPDPFGCRYQVRSELGIAPRTGKYYPGFFERVGKCIRSAQKGGISESPSRTLSNNTKTVDPDREDRSRLPKSSRRANIKEANHRPPENVASPILTEKNRATAPPATTELLSTTQPPEIAPPTVSEPGRRVALVIGNGNYSRVAALPNATNDAVEIARTLEGAGFQSVTLKLNLSREGMFNALEEFARQSDNADWAAVYYAGHGIESRGVNYLIPVDAKLQADRDIDIEAIDVGKVLNSLDGAKKLKLVVLDACRDNPFLSQMRRTSATRAISRGLARVEPDVGVLVVYSAKHGETASDGDGPYSVFASALLQRIRTPNLEIRRLFDLVRDDVMERTNYHQQPFTYGSLSGRDDFFFVRSK